MCVCYSCNSAKTKGPTSLHLHVSNHCLSHPNRNPFRRKEEQGCKEGRNRGEEVEGVAEEAREEREKEGKDEGVEGDGAEMIMEEKKEEHIGKEGKGGR